VRETTLQTLRSVKKGREEVLQAPEHRFPCSAWRRAWGGRLSPCSPWTSTVMQSVPGGLHPMERTRTGAVYKELQSVGRTHVGAVHGELSPVGATSRWIRERV